MAPISQLLPWDRKKRVESINIIHHINRRKGKNPCMIFSFDAENHLVKVNTLYKNSTN